MIQQCPVCGAQKRENIFYVSRVERNSDNTVKKDSQGNIVRVFDTPFMPDVQYTRICKYARTEGCLNKSTTLFPSETFESRSQGLWDVEKFIPMAQEVRDGLGI